MKSYLSLTLVGLAQLQAPFAYSASSTLWGEAPPHQSPQFLEISNSSLFMLPQKGEVFEKNGLKKLFTTDAQIQTLQPQTNTLLGLKDFKDCGAFCKSYATKLVALDATTFELKYELDIEDLQIFQIEATGHSDRVLFTSPLSIPPFVGIVSAAGIQKIYQAPKKTGFYIRGMTDDGSAVLVMEQIDSTSNDVKAISIDTGQVLWRTSLNVHSFKVDSQRSRIIAGVGKEPPGKPFEYFYLLDPMSGREICHLRSHAPYAFVVSGSLILASDEQGVGIFSIEDCHLVNRINSAWVRNRRFDGFSVRGITEDAKYLVGHPETDWANEVSFFDVTTGRALFHVGLHASLLYTGSSFLVGEPGQIRHWQLKDDVTDITVIPNATGLQTISTDDRGELLTYRLWDENRIQIVNLKTKEIIFSHPGHDAYVDYDSKWVIVAQSVDDHHNELIEKIDLRDGKILTSLNLSTTPHVYGSYFSWGKDYFSIYRPETVNEQGDTVFRFSAWSTNDLKTPVLDRVERGSGWFGILSISPDEIWAGVMASGYSGPDRWKLQIWNPKTQTLLREIQGKDAYFPFHYKSITRENRMILDNQNNSGFLVRDIQDPAKAQSLRSPYAEGYAATLSNFRNYVNSRDELCDIDAELNGKPVIVPLRPPEGEKALACSDSGNICLTQQFSKNNDPLPPETPVTFISGKTSEVLGRISGGLLQFLPDSDCFIHQKGNGNGAPLEFSCSVESSR